MSKAYIVSHTHWDREWYRPFQYFKVRLTLFMDDLLASLEQNPNYKHFMLDGQLVMIEDYLSVKPKNRKRISDLVCAGKLSIGPWYSQPDEFIPSGESLVRNLLIGIHQALDLGAYMKVGYLPDSFGQTCQMPQILKGFGIEYACMMRGVPVHKLEQSDFIWKGLNGDRVTATALATGYSNGMFMPKEASLIEVRINQAIKDLNKLGGQDNYLILNGVDHQFLQTEVANYIDIKRQTNSCFNLEHATLEDYFNQISKRTDNFTEIEGEMISPVTNRVHTSIASTRIYQKVINRQMEQLLIHQVEPLAAMAYAFGATYPNANINDAWKLMFQNQAHDSICGCCTDTVHREIDQRYTDVYNIGTTLYNMFSRSIAFSLASNNPVLVLWNTSFIKGRQLVKGDVYTKSSDFILQDKTQESIPFTVINNEIIDAAALSIWTLYLGEETFINKTTIQMFVDFEFNIGYKVFDIIESSTNSEPSQKSPQPLLTVTNDTVENEYLKVSINDNGTFDLTHKSTSITYPGLNEIEDCGCAGDTYNYSPVKNDTIIRSGMIRSAKNTITNHGSYAVIKTNYTLSIPAQLSDHDQQRSNNLVSLPVTSYVTIYADQTRVDIETTIDNQAKDHRIRVLFPTPILSHNSYSGTQFGTICRPNQIRESTLWEDLKWTEKPLPIYSQQRFSAINNGDYGFAVFNKGLSEYEIYEHKGSTIAITLLRGVGMMGKDNLSIRPGRPSGMPLPTPEAQCLGIQTYNYSLYPHKGDINTGLVDVEAIRYGLDGSFTQSYLPLKSLIDTNHNFFDLYHIPHMNDFVQQALIQLNQETCALISLSNPQVIISAFKKSEKADALILRVYNSTSKPISDTQLYIGLAVAEIHLCDFSESILKTLASKNNTCILDTINPYTAHTYQIELQKY